MTYINPHEDTGALEAFEDHQRERLEALRTARGAAKALVTWLTTEDDRYAEDQQRACGLIIRLTREIEDLADERVRRAQ